VGEAAPLRRVDGHLPIEDHGLIGDGRGAALVGRDGCVSWMCVPRFDSPPLFCEILDHQDGGGFLVAPEEARESRQRYLPDSAVLVTELRAPSGAVEVTDAFMIRAGAELARDRDAARGELLRHVRVTGGEVRLRVRVTPRDATVHAAGPDVLRLDSPAHHDSDLRLLSSRPLAGTDTVIPLREGEELWLALRWEPDRPDGGPVEPRRVIEDTAAAWRRWMAGIVYDGPRPELVRRSAITLKLLDHISNGAIVAAPTSSLPEAIGGPRNWDYRYVWVRDAAFSVFALRRIGLDAEADSFLSWVLSAVGREGAPLVVYDLDGGHVPKERVDERLAGYRGSVPVRWGNDAADQTQHDAYGEILDTAFQWRVRGRSIDEKLWSCLAELVETARSRWRTPDHGIWEVRTQGSLFTYSVAMCQVALDRGARLAHRLDLPGDLDGWAAEARVIRETILRDAWDDEMRSLTGTLGPEIGLDASLLALPLRRVLPADHPRMVATTRAVRDRLGAGGGLLYRYDPEEMPDGVNGEEGAFLLCSFWLADNLLGQGHVDEAGELFEELCDLANPLGLLSEEIDPGDRSFLGNFPQAFSHVGLISSGVALGRALHGRRPELSTEEWFPDGH
jgi:GH15 family glucan-1,4-alpha-glucosidase